MSTQPAAATGAKPLVLESGDELSLVSTVLFSWRQADDNNGFTGLARASNRVFLNMKPQAVSSGRRNGNGSRNKLRRNL